MCDISVFLRYQQPHHLNKRLKVKILSISAGQKLALCSFGSEPALQFLGQRSFGMPQEVLA